jgi:hypothetical protein
MCMRKCAELNRLLERPAQPSLFTIGRLNQALEQAELLLPSSRQCVAGIDEQQPIRHLDAEVLLTRWACLRKNSL